MINHKKSGVAVLKTVVMSALLLVTLAPAANAGTATASGNWVAAIPAQTMTPEIPTPAGTQKTTFTGPDSGPYGYTLLPFTVNQSGTYSATVTVNGSVHTSWFLSGLFTPNSTVLVTPLSNFFAGIFSTANPGTGNFTSLNLVAGQQYTWLIAYGSNPVGLNYSATVTGPGCIAMGTNTCTTAAIPTLSTWGIIALISMMAVGSFLTLRRRQV
ncbi:hypothetical protein [Acidovorax sp. 106]|uniref:hypothetical protein n=1 Tax=Acidovorax sp. 106 TaxID=2135637 RepID=UPI000F0EC17B|nr:hypothetical protein [Acidovorax sp. 106]RLJ40003.1 putative secreted protein (IPTL-CTERM system target) [Acidovorax sp. 106]